MRRESRRVIAASVVVLVSLWFGGLSAGAQSNSEPGPLSEERDPSHKDYQGPREYAPSDWQERTGDMPGVPEDGNLVELVVPGSRYDYRIDATTLTLGRDGVTRYVVVMKIGAVRNVVYEGLRCETKEYRTLAFLSSNGKFKRRRASRWRVIDGSDSSYYRWILWSRYLCNSGGSHREAKEAIAAIRGEY